MDITLLVTLAEEVAPEILRLIQERGGTAMVQTQLDANKAQIQADQQHIADELAHPVDNGVDDQ